ncbi:MAG: WcbI family polysaccharide biosynthesis putative acetyltransferase [Lachnospiraceae bacterium]|nr:WcbI family polysaccharide biosynthesis putative acetyltransferase [Lachnospiraceae bacterium]
MSLLTTDHTIKEKLKHGCAVRGTGIHGAKCAWMLRRYGIDIRYFISKNGGGVETFRGKQIYRENVEGLYILVATSPEVYWLVSDELRNEGKREFEDFAYYEWLFKDVVLLHGNCHMEIIRKFLLSSSAFRDRFAIYPYPLLVSATKQFRTEPEIFRHIDVWIHQDIRRNNQFGYKVSDEYIRSNVSPEIREIIIPHLYGIGKMLFPQSISLDGNEAINDGLDGDGLFLHGDKVIEKAIGRGMKMDEMIEYCKSDNVISEEEIKDNFFAGMTKLQEREKLWDIPIYDFIKDNYQEEKLFYDDGHPTNFVMKRIAEEILKRLQIYDLQIYCDSKMDLNEKCVYPVVKKVLGLRWEDKEIRVMGKKLAEHMDFEEYIREYCWWRHGDKYMEMGVGELL